MSARMISSHLRPLYPEGFRKAEHNVATVMSVDKSNSPTIAALIGASAALHVSDIPYGGPVSGVKVSRVNGRFVLNPTLAEQAESDLEITIAGTKDAVTMEEAGAHEVPEQAI